MTDEIKIQIKEFLISETIKEFTAQGHHLTGGFESALSVAVTEENLKTIFEVSGAYYGRFLQSGVASSKASFKQFPFVLQYVKLRMKLDEEKAKGVAAAIINKWKKTGNPTPGSYQYSKNSRRLDFIGGTMESVSNNMQPLVQDEAQQQAEVALAAVIKRINQLNKD